MRSNAIHSVERKSFWKKAGRKIHVGDCALFKLTDGSPPFVGIIRRLIVGKEENLSLSVNWFYRPADVKLGQGAVLEAAPNEVFYSFHKDEIPAASLLHPCKVSFLRKGVELPSWMSSFVCRRVYDLENKCLWWLTDQNSINKRQEIEQLLDKTQAEMYGVAQRGVQSPKPLDAPNGTAQLNPSLEKTQKNSISSPVKIKKREQGPDSVNRESVLKGDAGQHKPKHVLKSEIAAFTDKGGLVDFEGVEKLIQLMQPESGEKKVDLASRVMLVDVISFTDRFDCLSQFVHLRGLLILNEWLQEVRKGKIGDGNGNGNGSPKGSDEEFLLALLRALDRLPVNLHALQTCNVGKSVNHLRSHKNSEIQKKARSLVDTWKKRVEAEMISGYERPVSGSSDTDSKISALNSQPGKANAGETVAKSPGSPSPIKLAAAGIVSSDVSRVTDKKARTFTGVHKKHVEPEKNVVKTRSSEPDAKIPASQGKPNSCETIPESLESPGFIKPASAGTGSSDMPLMTTRDKKSSSSPESAANVSCVDNMNNQRRSLEDASTTPGKSCVVHPKKQEHDDSRGREQVVVAMDMDLCQGLVGGDDVGLNLLASVVAGEMSTSNTPIVCSQTSCSSSEKHKQSSNSKAELQSCVSLGEESEKPNLDFDLNEAVPSDDGGDHVLEFDLNVGVIEDVKYVECGGVDLDLDLDLNACDESGSNSERRHFDLNSGPGLEETSVSSKGMQFLCGGTSFPYVSNLSNVGSSYSYRPVISVGGGSDLWRQLPEAEAMGLLKRKEPEGGWEPWR